MKQLKKLFMAVAIITCAFACQKVDDSHSLFEGEDLESIEQQTQTEFITTEGL